MEKYERPGVKINSKPPSQEYKDNYDRIFGKKESWLELREREQRLKEITDNPEKAKEFLVNAGIIDDDCNLTEHYKDDNSID